jgi:hypothetical protein
MKIDPLAPLALVGMSLAAIGIVMVASSVEPPRVVPVAPTVKHTPVVQSPAPESIPTLPSAGPQPQITT